MKKRLLFIMACVWLSTNLYSKGPKIEIVYKGNSVVITYLRPGRLSQLLDIYDQSNTSFGSKSIYDCKKLTISGSIDDNDYTTIRTKMKSLEIIDLGGVNELFIPDGAFKSAHSHVLKEVVLPCALLYIGNNAFKGCKNLKAIRIPGEVTINDGAFQDCINLHTLTIPNGISKFSNKISPELNGITKLIILGRIYIGDLERIKDGMKSLITIDLSKASMDHLDDKAFYKSGVKNVTLPESILSIGVSAFEGCTNLTDISIPSSVETIGDLAFADCKKLASVTLLNGIKSIGNKSFAGSHLTEITIPGSVKTIGTQAFADCKTLKTVTLKDGVQRIEDRALPPTYCITSYSKIPPKLSSALESLYGDTITVYVPAGNMSAYKNAEYWNRDYVHIYEFNTNPTILDSIPYLPDFTMPFINVGYLAPAFKDNTTTAANDALSLSQNENSILAINGISKEGNGVLTVFKNENGGITINGINPAGGGTVTVRDMGGRVSKTCSITGTSTTVNRRFGAGIYLVTVNTQGNMITKKIVL
jgi:hypothetical protein